MPDHVVIEHIDLRVHRGGLRCGVGVNDNVQPTPHGEYVIFPVPERHLGIVNLIGADSPVAIDLSLGVWEFDRAFSQENREGAGGDLGNLLPPGRAERLRNVGRAGL